MRSIFLALLIFCADARAGLMPFPPEGWRLPQKSVVDSAPTEEEKVVTIAEPVLEKPLAVIPPPAVLPRIGPLHPIAQSFIVSLPMGVNHDPIPFLVQSDAVMRLLLGQPAVLRPGMTPFGDPMNPRPGGHQVVTGAEILAREQWGSGAMTDRILAPSEKEREILSQWERLIPLDPQPWINEMLKKYFTSPMDIFNPDLRKPTKDLPSTIAI